MKTDELRAAVGGLLTKPTFLLEQLVDAMERANDIAVLKLGDDHKAALAEKDEARKQARMKQRGQIDTRRPPA